MLQHDKMILMDYRGQREPLSTGGGGAGQGKRQSPDIFNLVSIFVRDRVEGAAEGAAVRMPDWILAALGQMRRRAPAPAAARRREWSGDAARRLFIAQEQLGGRTGRTAKGKSGLQEEAEAALREAAC